MTLVIAYTIVLWSVIIIAPKYLILLFAKALTHHKKVYIILH